MHVSKSIEAFLTAQREAHPGKDLLDFYLGFGTDLETQVNVAAGNGQPVAGKRSTYSDGLNEWWSIRIPKFADSDPQFSEYELRWPLELHAEAIGSTGWDWRQRLSRYVGFDFDAIAGHAKGVGVTDEKLLEIREAAKALPYVQVRRSTGGSGLHLYVFFESGVPTQNHTEHSALARCVLGMMSAEVGFDFASQVDACGGNMWLWHLKANADNQGLSLIKAAEPLKSPPANWQDHIEVVTRRRAKVRVHGIEAKDEDIFEQLSSAHRQVPLDDAHKEHIDELARLNFPAVWIPDRHLLQTHTVGLARIHEKLKLAGVFQTNSPGSDTATANCFCYPSDFGSWHVYRFSQGVAEARTWEQDGQGWTTCWFNRRPNLRTAARALGGRDLKGSGGYEFDTLEQAAQVGALLGTPIEVEDKLKDRTAIVKKDSGGRLVIEVPKDVRDDDSIGNWNSADKKKFWTQVFDVPAEPLKDQVADYDNLVRPLETPTGDPAGWAIKNIEGVWGRAQESSIKQCLQSTGLSKTEAECVMGQAVRRRWKLVTLPFQPEFPGNRQWNWDAPQFRFRPAPRSDEIVTQHPHWDLILDHIGRDLDEPLAALDWAKRENIRTGADYLRALFACIIRDPFEPTPYIFVFGEENCGKSILWESFSLLLTKGVVKADRALTNQQDFNGELANAIVCVVEEKDIAKTPGAHAKLKEAVTAKTLSIRRMRTDTFQVPNMTHWFQFSNNVNACFVATGDTRITMIYVNKLEREIPKKLLLPKLEEEAPAFLRTLLDIQLPPVEGRLRLPVVETHYKSRAEDLNRPIIEQFIAEHTHFVPGEMIPFSEFYERFNTWLPPEEQYQWSRIKVSRALPIKNPCGAYTENKRYIGNLSFENKEPEKDAKMWIVKDGRLRRQI